MQKKSLPVRTRSQMRTKSVQPDIRYFKMFVLALTLVQLDRNMKTCFAALFWISLILSSCKEVAFREPQPQGVAALKEIPQALRGKYRPKTQPGDEKNDTLIIESWGYHFKDKEEKDWLGRGVISDSMIVKSYQDYYFVNFRSGNQWVLRLVKQKPDGTISFMSIDIQDDAKRKEMVRKLSRKFNMKEIKNGDDTFYLINPTSAQLMQLIRDGYFTGPDLMKTK
jgi:hypothetical protein